jgi:hypothetical protein
MPTLKHSVPKYRKHRSSGQAIVTVAGRDHYLGPYGTKASRIEYDRLITEWLASGRPTTIAEQSGITVSELIVQYWRHARKRYVKNGQPTSERDLVRMALSPVRELYGRVPVTDFGPLALKAVRSKFIQRDCARKTVNDNTRRIVRMFRWGVAEQVVPPMVLQALMAVEGNRGLRDPLPGVGGGSLVLDGLLEPITPICDRDS